MVNVQEINLGRCIMIILYQENHVVAQWVSVTTSRLMVRLLKMSIYEFVMTTWRIIPGLVSVVRVTTPSFTSHGVLPFGRGKPVNRNPILTRGQKLTMGQLTAYWLAWSSKYCLYISYWGCSIAIAKLNQGGVGFFVRDHHVAVWLFNQLWTLSSFFHSEWFLFLNIKCQCYENPLPSNCWELAKCIDIFYIHAS